ncbi:hypothetical protein DXA57_04210 [Blautia sp. OF03-15BH]|uniref:hypothetical protein n=1 Tax=Blautia sp. OF03-15BH TaxID=2292287 RepID=UPI000E50FBFE|nr:hypothetical protein [Blautia sp. OF03-15BH]RGY02474.1 hypothetical protein DXA57_04210 [Blautia sp. OF03-15BH]
MIHSKFNKDFKKVIKEYEELYKDFSSQKYDCWKRSVSRLKEDYGEDVYWFVEREKDIDIIGNNKIAFVSDKFTKIILPIIITFLTSSIVAQIGALKNICIIAAITLTFVALVITIITNVYFNKNYAIKEKFYDDCLDILRN